MKKVYETILKNKANLLFIVLLLLVSLLYNYQKILTSRPYSTHQWRQADCLSITMNYYKENRNFLEPAIHWVGEKDGKTVSECPIIYYSVAQLWKVFGHHEFIFRLINILIVFTGLFCLFKLMQGIISDTFWSITITLLLFTSPILVFYSNNFTADAPAFGLALIACYFMWKGIKEQKRVWYYLSFLIFLLGGLIKISSLIVFIAILLIHTYLVFFSKKEKTYFFYRWYNLIPYLIVLFVIFIWYNFAFHYNEENLSGIFLTGIYPIWEADVQMIKNIWINFKNTLVPAYLNKNALYVALALFFLLFPFYRKLNKLLFYINVFVFLGVVAYLLLFYKAFSVHDYYLTNLLIFVPLPFIAMLEMLRRNYSRIFKLLPLKILVLCGVLLLMYETSVVNRMKYSTDDMIVKSNLIVDNYAVNIWTGIHLEYANRFKAFETITPYLRSLGIERTDRVLSLPEGSINISLYLMDQKGYSGFGYDNIPFDQRMKFYTDHGVKFLVIDSVLNTQDYLLPYLNNKMGDYKNISVYSLY